MLVRDMNSVSRVFANVPNALLGHFTQVPRFGYVDGPREELR